jgi:hypothetical protein
VAVATNELAVGVQEFQAGLRYQHPSSADVSLS